MRIALVLTLCAASPLLGCGGAPTKPVEETGAAPAAPDPDAANPCDATTIDPTENPCAGPAADAARREAEAAAAGEGDRAAGEDSDDDVTAKPAQGSAGASDEGEPGGAVPPVESTPEG